MSLLRAMCHLAVGANRLFEQWVDQLVLEGFEISRDTAVDSMLDSDIVFACGLLTATRIAEGRPLEVVAAPVFEGESAPVYRSLIITRNDGELSSIDDVPGLRLAVNEYESWSGWHGLKHHLGKRGILLDSRGGHLLTGGHVDSIAAVLEGHADIAAIDHSVWNALQATEPRLAELRIVDATEDWPTPPISVSRSVSTDVRDRLVAAILALPAVVPASSADYDFMLRTART